MDNIERIMREAQASYDEEYRTKGLHIVTTEMDKTDDKCDGRNKGTKGVTVMKYYTVRPKEDFMNERYEEYNGEVYEKYVETIQPPKFYSETEVYNYARYINKIAGRTLEIDEMNLLLKTISRGRQYKLTCLVDRTKEFKGETIWRDKR